MTEARVIDVAILIALPEEFRALAADYSHAWEHARSRGHPGRDYFFTGPGGYRCVAAISPGMGTTLAAKVSDALLAYEPAVIVNVGIAGGFTDDLCIGDVVVPPQVDAYDQSGKISGPQGEWTRRNEAYKPDPRCVAEVRELLFSAGQAYGAWRERGLEQLARLEDGPDGEAIAELVDAKLLRRAPEIGTRSMLASGSFVVASKAFAQWVRSANAEVHAGEMEAAGMLAAAFYQPEGPPGLVLRGISDHVDADKERVDAIGEGALRRLAMANAWRLLCTLMELGYLPRKPAGVEKSEAAAAPAPPRPPPRVAPTRLPAGAPKLFGREAELARLDACWRDPAVRVLTIVAWGGVGKTALLHAWRRRMLAPGHEDPPELVFDWSFYSQGTRDRGAVSAESFIGAALRFFGDPDMAASKASGWDKGSRLAELVGERRALLILDGLEPLQYAAGSGREARRLKEESVVALLRGLAGHSRGLCVVSTRVAVEDLRGDEQGSAPRLELGRLGRDSGVELLRSVLGEGQGTAEELGEIWKAVEGHALSLELLGSYIRRSGKDLRAWREIDFKRADEVQGGHAFRVMDAYVKWLEGAGERGAQQLAALRLLGLFDRPAQPDCVAALRAAPEVAGLNAGLVGVEGEAWRVLVSELVEARLLRTSEYVYEPVLGYDEQRARAAGKYGQPKGEPARGPAPQVERGAVVLDAHPLIREYFGAELKRRDEQAWREGHRRLYVHLQEVVPYWPEGVDGLQPLYQAVVHGCAAGEVQEACDAVYLARISRGSRAYVVHQLGAFSADLAAVSCFFEGDWGQPSTKLKTPDQSWVLSEAAFLLRALGRLEEALEPMRAGLEMDIEGEDWRNASVLAGNLSELELTLGETQLAVDDARLAVDYAERSGDDFQRMLKPTTLADALLAAGEGAQARELFEQAEAMQAEQQPSYPLLYSLQGYRYCDLLLCPAERAAWRVQPSEQATHDSHLQRCAEVFERAQQTLAWVRAAKLPRLDIALDHLSLGRAALYAARLGAPPSSTPSLPQAREQLEAALTNLRKAGHQDQLPRGLLARALLHHTEHHPERAAADLDEAESIARRGPMPLHLADVHLHRARIFRDRAALARARELIDKHSYERRREELEDAERAAATW